MGLLSLIGVFLFPNISLGSTLYSQTETNTNGPNFTFTGFSQGLDNSLTGNVSVVTLRFRFNTSIGSNDYRVRLITNNGSTVYNSATTTVNYSTSYQDVDFIFNTPVNLANFGTPFTGSNSDIYWRLQLEPVGPNPSVGIQGVGTNVATDFPQGHCFIISTQCGSVLDWYFILSGDLEGSTIYDLEPENNGTTSTTTVNFRFSYTNPNSFYTNYIIYYRDISLPSPITFSQLTGTINSTSGTISRNFPLTNSRIYSWSVSLCNVDNTSCFSSPQQQFSVVTPFYLNSQFIPFGATTTYQYPNSGVSTSSLSAIQELDCGVGDILSNGGIGQCIASVFSFLFLPNPAILSQFATIPDQMTNKLPFAYVTAIERAYGNIVLNATSSLPLLNIPLSQYASSTVTGVIPDIEISTTTISTYFPDNIRLLLHSFLIAILWLGFGWLALGETMKIFKT